MDDLIARIRSCTACAAQLPHAPRPIIQASPKARLLIIGQAPGSKVNASGVAWQDDSGKRLLDWLDLEPEAFYDPASVALMPMGLCYPGRTAHADAPPRPECAPLWHARVLAELTAVELVLLVGSHAQHHYLPNWRRLSMTEKITRWRESPAPFLPLPHPSWRVVRWLRDNSWFATDLLPELRRRVRSVLK